MSAYTEVMKYINNATDKKHFYDDIRKILTNCKNYPEDWEIKRLQRAADNKYLILQEAEQI